MRSASPARRVTGFLRSLGRMRTIEASRCVLEPQVAAHACEMFSVLSDPAIYEFENEPPPARRPAREPVLPIIRPAGQAPSRRRHLRSNVRAHRMPAAPGHRRRVARRAHRGLVAVAASASGLRT